MAASGNSGTPLAKKLGIKDRFKIRLVNQPAYYFGLFTDLPENVEIFTNKKNTKNLVHYFTKKASELYRDIKSLRQEIYPSGTLWISWPKKASKIQTDVTEDIIRNIAKNKSVELLDLRKAFVSYLATHNPSNQYNGVLTIDGVHMNEKGNRFLADQFFPYVR